VKRNCRAGHNQTPTANDARRAGELIWKAGKLERSVFVPVFLFSRFSFFRASELLPPGLGISPVVS
jgi:hypothetical protein